MFCSLCVQSRPMGDTAVWLDRDSEGAGPSTAESGVWEHCTETPGEAPLWCRFAGVLRHPRIVEGWRCEFAVQRVLPFVVLTDWEVILVKKPVRQKLAQANWSQLDQFNFMLLGSDDLSKHRVSTCKPDREYTLRVLFMHTRLVLRLLYISHLFVCLFVHLHLQRIQ